MNGQMIDLSAARVLIVAPHPDDEVLGCGGIIHRCKQAGGKVYVLFLTVGDTKDYSPIAMSLATERLREAEAVARLLSIDGFRIAFPGNDRHLRLDTLPRKEVIDEIESGPEISFEAVRPNVVICPGGGDYHQDHWVANQATLAAARPAPPSFKSFQPMVLTYEIPSNSWSTLPLVEPQNVLITLTRKDVQIKCRAMKLYKSQLKTAHGPISVHAITALARIRGIASGGLYAEAFGLKRAVV